MLRLNASVRRAASYGLPLLYVLLLVAALGLVWLVQDQPLEQDLVAGLFHVDALSAFFILLTVLLALVQTINGATQPLRQLLATLLLLVAYSSSQLLLLAACYLSAGLLLWRGTYDVRDFKRFLPALAANLLPILCIGLAVVVLWRQSGVWHYTLPAAGAGLNSLSFGFLLMATYHGWMLDADPTPNGAPARTHPFSALAGARSWLLHRPPAQALDCRNLLFDIACFYPLIRLYSLGPWNLGWLFATLLLGGATALWAAWGALRPDATSGCRSQLVQVQAGLALVGIGLGSSAGLAAACYALLIVPVLVLGFGAWPVDEAGNANAAAHAPRAALRPWCLWLLSGALPLTAPFVAAWMALGAAAAGGVLLLAGAVWFAALVATLAVARRIALTPPGATGWRLLLAAGASLGLGAASPGVVQWLIRPIVQQLQGGLTPFGDLLLWPWAGLLAHDATRQTVAALPSFALIGLMLVLGALAWLAARLLAMQKRDG